MQGASRSRFIVGVALAVAALGAHAQDQCNALLDHGIRDITSLQSSAHAIAYNYHSYCGLDFKNESDSKVRRAAGSVFGYGSASGGDNTSSLRQRLIKWCDENREFASSRLELAQEANVISQPAITAWAQCMDMHQKNVRIKFSPSGEHSRFVHFEIDSTADSDLRFLGITEHGYECKVSMRKRSGGWFGSNDQPYIDNGNIQIDCTRDAPKVVERAGAGVLTYDEGYISINTDGPSLPVSFPKVVESYAVTPPSSVLAFDATECPAGWSPYEQAYGRFIRGIDPREQGGADPDGVRAPGHQQQDELKSHNHTSSHHALVHRRYGGPRQEDMDPGSWAGWMRLPTNSAGGKETRPKNVALLYCRRNQG